MSSRICCCCTSIRSMSSPRSEQIVISGGLEYEVEEGDEGKKAEFMVATLLAPPRGAGTNNQCEQMSDRKSVV